jgi:sodium/potassium/calcium exchanger 6
VIAQEYLSPCVDEFIVKFSNTYKYVEISPTLAGVTFLAFANGAPDVMTAIIAGSSDSDTTALIPFGSIFGACLFSAAFILSAVILAQPN